MSEQRYIKDAPKDGTPVLICTGDGIISATWKTGTKYGSRYTGWMGCHGKWIENPLWWYPMPAKTHDVQLSQNDAAEVIRALKRAISLDEGSMKYYKKGYYHDYCVKQVNMLRRVVRELQAGTGSVMLRVEAWAADVRRTK